MNIQHLTRFLPRMARNQNMRILFRIHPKQRANHIRFRQANTAGGWPLAAMKENGAAPFRDSIGRRIEANDASIGIRIDIILQMLHIVVPTFQQIGIVPLLPGIIIDGIRIADPVCLGRDIPPGHFQPRRLLRIAERQAQRPQTGRGGIAVTLTAMQNPIAACPPLHPA